MDLDWIKIITNIGAFGLVAWLVIYVFKATIPGMIVQFRDEQRIERESARRREDALMEALSEQRHDFLAHNKLQREDSIKALENTNQCLALNTATLTDVKEAFEQMSKACKIINGGGK